MDNVQLLINQIQEYLDSGMWEHEACYLDKADLTLIINVLQEYLRYFGWEDYTKDKIKTLNQISDEIQGKILKGIGVYLINSTKGMKYVLDAIDDHLDFLTGGTIQHD